MKRIGVHMSFTSVNDVINGMKAWKLNTLQIATRNMRNMRQRISIQQDLQQLAGELSRQQFYPLVIHAPYALNPASPDPGTRDKCVKVFQADMDMMPNCEVKYVIHPGSSMGYPWQNGVEWLIETLKQVKIPRNVQICVEMMAGAGSQLMCSQEQIESLLRAQLKGVFLTFDSCHVFAAGMFCTNVLKEYKDKIKVVHLNGSEFPFKSFKDRHAKVAGNGLCEILFSMVPDDTPVILETPTITMQEDVEWLHKLL